MTATRWPIKRRSPAATFVRWRAILLGGTVGVLASLPLSLFRGAGGDTFALFAVAAHSLTGLLLGVVAGFLWDQLYPTDKWRPFIVAGAPLILGPCLLGFLLFAYGFAADWGTFAIAAAIGGLFLGGILGLLVGVGLVLILSE